jgi:probable F420-dependent oxidoreductase
LFAHDLGRFGVWWSGSWHDADDRDLNVAGELESLGYGTLWSSGGFEPGLAPRFGELLTATDRAVVASGIASIWTTTPADVGQEIAGLEERFDGRFLFGIGASHAMIVQDYSRPYSRMVEYLDGLDALDPSDPPVPPDRRVLAALGPRMLELAKERAAGAHPYFVPVEHTAYAREVLGSGPLLAPEVAVVLETDRVAAMERARQYASIYLPLPNYTNNLRRFGFTDDDIEGGGSDRLIEAVIPCGDAATVAEQVRAHLDAGADHVCVQVIADFFRFPLAAYRELAPALLAS